MSRKCETADDFFWWRQVSQEDPGLKAVPYPNPEEPAQHMAPHLSLPHLAPEPAQAAKRGVAP